jgi:hypothetical protein
MTNKFISACYLSTYVQFSSANTEAEVGYPLKVMYPNAHAQLKILEEYNIKKYIDE